MNDYDIKIKILRYLDPTKRKDLRSLAEELGINLDQFNRKYLIDLSDNGLIKFHFFPHYLGVTITSKGIAFLAK